MHLRALHLQNFRNLEQQSIEFSGGFNYLMGPNGAGKTAVLEAIHLLARGRSFRTNKTAAMVAHGASDLIVRGEIETNGRRQQLAMRRSRSGETELRLNGEPQRRASALARYMPVLILLPDASELIFGGPGERRGFLDWGVFHVEHAFLESSRAYRRVLTQRNAWLKSLGGDDAERGFAADPWATQLETLGNELNAAREEYVARLSPLFARMLESLNPGHDVALTYYWGGTISSSESRKKLAESWSRDVKFGMTHRGPHRADLVFTIDDQPAAETVSRGQAKLIASAAILAQADLLCGQSDTRSLFLIDDFGAELDVEHWRYFLRTLLGLECQVIATSTEPIDERQDWIREMADLRVFHVEQGVVSGN